jgi:hypothetical protein
VTGRKKHRREEKMKRIVLIGMALTVMLSFLSQNTRAFSINGDDDSINIEFLDDSKIMEVLEKKITYIKKKIRDISQRVQKQTDNIASLRALTDGLQKENRCLAEMAEKLEGIVASLPEERLSIDATLKDIEITAAALITENRDIAEWISTLRNNVAMLQPQITDLETRTVGFQAFFDHVTFDPEDITGLKAPDVIFTGVNVHIRSGVGFTDDPGSGLGNLIVGYNENLFGSPRTGSHNLVVGSGHGYSSWGGFVAGFGNTISGPYASVSGGSGNTAAGYASSVSGGQWLEALEDFSYAPRRDAAQ